MARAATTSNKSPEVARTGRAEGSGTGHTSGKPQQGSAAWRVKLASTYTHRPMPQAACGVSTGDGDNEEREAGFMLRKKF